MKRNTFSTSLVVLATMLALGRTSAQEVVDPRGPVVPERVDGRILQMEGDPAAATPAEPESYLHLIVRIDDAGGPPQVVGATRVPGRAVHGDVPLSPYLYAIRSGGKTIAAESIADPFEQRSFPGPPGSGRERELITRLRTADIVVKVPSVAATDAALSRVSISVFRLAPSQRVARVDPGTVDRLVRERKAVQAGELTPLILAPQVKQRLRVLRAP